MAKETYSGVFKNVLKTNFKVENKLEAFYTGGKIQFTSDGEVCLCACGNKIQAIDTKSGRILRSLQEDDDEITCFALSPNDEVLVTVSRNLLLRQWDWRNEKVTRKWKALHYAPVVSMAFDQTSTLLATGSSDSTIKIWDIIKQYCTHNFRGSQGVVHLVKFHPDPEKLMLFSSSADSIIRVWDLNTSICVSTLKGHYSNVTSLAFLEDNEKLISAGRDKVIIFWDLSTRTSIKTVPVYESIESISALPKDKELEWCISDKDGQHSRFVTCGEKGSIRAWSFPSGKCIFTQTKKSSSEQADTEKSTATTPAIIQCILNKALNCIITVSDDQNIVLYDLDTLKVSKQFVGHLDEILDLKFVGEDHSLLSIASNSPEIKVVDRETMDCRILSGHTDTVMALDASCDGKYIASCSKDNSVRVWKLGEGRTFSCVALGFGHTHAVGSVAWPKNSTDYLLTGSQDLTLKFWKLPQIFEEKTIAKITTVWTAMSHDKDINSVVFSPNDKLVASGSQDKTAKIWLASDGSLYGTLRGHKRGIWCAVFSTVDKCLATASADSTIKIWAIQDLTCVKTLEGHTNSVLKLEFMTRGMQIISSGSDGLIKIWNVRTNDCINTLDEHVDKVWSLAVNKAEDTLVTGGGDSVLNIWKDVTEEERILEEAKQENLILKDQELSNLLEQKKYTKAIGLALTLERPFRVLSILKELLDQPNGSKQIEKVVNNLRDDQIDSMLKYMRDWNTNAKHCHATQSVLSIILKSISPDDLAGFSEMKDNIEALLPYTERHFNRLNRLLQQSTFLEYTWESMRLSAKDVDIDETEQVNTIGEASNGGASQLLDASPIEQQTSLNENSSTIEQQIGTSEFVDGGGKIITKVPDMEVDCSAELGVKISERPSMANEEGVLEENKENEKAVLQEEDDPSQTPPAVKKKKGTPGKVKKSKTNSVKKFRKLRNNSS